MSVSRGFPTSPTELPGGGKGFAGLEQVDFLNPLIILVFTISEVETILIHVLHDCPAMIERGIVPLCFSEETNQHIRNFLHIRDFYLNGIYLNMKCRLRKKHLNITAKPSTEMAL